ncbi:MAG: site-specific DNA-methyltransferase [Candidatus Diapherotrites archaeon]
MKAFPDESVDLIVTDPPFNIGKKYNTYVDRMKKIEYVEWCKNWLGECIRMLKKKGSLYLFNYPENNAYLMPFLDEKLIFKRWMTWHYPTNTGMSPTNFTRSQHSILFYTKSKNAVFNKKEIAEPYRNPTDKRILERIKNGSNGKVPYDVFQFNLVKNVSKEKTEHVCQLPEKLVEIFVKASSNKGDLVFDPFMGSGTVAVAAKKLNRDYLGCEIDKKYCKIIESRLKDTMFPLERFIKNSNEQKQLLKITSALTQS